MAAAPLIATAWATADYVSALEKAGAAVLRLQPSNDRIEDVLERCDGVLLTGGPDVAPDEYGATEVHPTVRTERERDAYELALARQAMEANVPVLGICRGLQVMNVARGGTLVQDVGSELTTTLSHWLEQPAPETAHAVRVFPGTRLASVAGPPSGGELSVNSRHHQAIRNLGAGLIVSAAAPDGVIEAIEIPDSAFCVGVQWHPENFWRTGEFDALFTAFVRAAHAHRSGRIRSSD